MAAGQEGGAANMTYWDNIIRPFFKVVGCSKQFSTFYMASIKLNFSMSSVICIKCMTVFRPQALWKLVSMSAGISQNIKNKSCLLYFESEKFWDDIPIEANSLMIYWSVNLPWSHSSMQHMKRQTGWISFFIWKGKLRQICCTTL